MCKSTNKLNVIIRGIQNFQSGNLKARIAVKSNNELDTIGLANIEVTSPTGKGTIFTFTLPILQIA